MSVFLKSLKAISGADVHKAVIIQTSEEKWWSSVLSKSKGVSDMVTKTGLQIISQGSSPEHEFWPSIHGKSYTSAKSCKKLHICTISEYSSSKMVM